MLAEAMQRHGDAHACMLLRCLAHPLAAIVRIPSRSLFSSAPLILSTQRPLLHAGCQQKALVPLCAAPQSLEADSLLVSRRRALRLHSSPLGEQSPLLLLRPRGKLHRSTCPSLSSERTDTAWPYAAASYIRRRATTPAQTGGKQPLGTSIALVAMPLRSSRSLRPAHGMQVDPRGLPGLGGEHQPECIQHLQGIHGVQRVRALSRMLYACIGQPRCADPA